MKLKFKADHTIGEFREQFNTLFPRLSVRLFTESHEAGEGSPATQQVDADRKLGEWMKVESVDTIELTPEMTIAELEQLLEDHGLHAQVFRRSGNLWLETTQSDQWTLERANNETY